MTRPLNAENNSFDYPWFSQVVSYTFSIGEGIGVMGKTDKIATRKLLRSMVDTYEHLKAKPESELNEAEKTVVQELGEIFVSA